MVGPEIHDFLLDDQLAVDCIHLISCKVAVLVPNRFCWCVFLKSSKQNKTTVQCSSRFWDSTLLVIDKFPIEVTTGQVHMQRKFFSYSYCFGSVKNQIYTYFIRYPFACGHRVRNTRMHLLSVLFTPSFPL